VTLRESIKVYEQIKASFSRVFLSARGISCLLFYASRFGFNFLKALYYQAAGKSLQYLGFYQRPLSTVIFILIISLLFIFYFSFLYLAKKRPAQAQTLAILTIITAVILGLSYNAFSYDLFNYIFDARIVSHYHLIHIFIKRRILRATNAYFMRWTHRFYPMAKLAHSDCPLTFIGMNYFLPTFFLFKLLMACHFWAVVFLSINFRQAFPENKLFNVVFSLQPVSSNRVFDVGA